MPDTVDAALLRRIARLRLTQVELALCVAIASGLNEFHGLPYSRRGLFKGMASLKARGLVNLDGAAYRLRLRPDDEESADFDGDGLGTPVPSDDAEASDAVEEKSSPDAKLGTSVPTILQRETFPAPQPVFSLADRVADQRAKAFLMRPREQQQLAFDAWERGGNWPSLWFLARNSAFNPSPQCANDPDVVAALVRAEMFARSIT